MLTYATRFRVSCQGFFLALRIPAAMADIAAFLVGKQAAALGTLPGDVPGCHIATIPGLFDNAAIGIVGGRDIARHVLLQDAGDGIGAGEHRLAVFPGYRGAADASYLFHYRRRLYSRPQRQGDEAAGGFKLGGSAAPGFTQ